MYVCMYVYVYLLYFGRKYDCLRHANFSKTSAIKLIFTLKMEFSNFEGKYQVT